MPAESGGCFVSGGTAGNLSALVAARHAASIARGGKPPTGWPSPSPRALIRPSRRRVV
jgi:glutamate/tyrosine decarboxylase-like PLP-dependent enzyme